MTHSRFGEPFGRQRRAHAWDLLVDILGIGPIGLPLAQIGVYYAVTLTASGGSAPYTWALSGEPDWLDIDIDTGELSGTPDADVTSETFTVTATDSEEATFERTYILRILPEVTMITAPAADDVETSTTVTITAALGLATTSIDFQLATAADETNVIDSASADVDGEWSPADLSPLQSYHVRARARNVNGVSDWTDWLHFSVNTIVDANFIGGWLLNEESDGSAPVTRVNSHTPGTNDFADFPPYAASREIALGVLEAQFVRSAINRLSIASNAALVTGDVDFTAGIEIVHDSLTGNQGYIGKGGNYTGASVMTWAIRKNSPTGSGVVSFDISNGSTIVSVPWSEEIAIGQRFGVIIRHNAGENWISIQIGGGTPVILNYGAGFTPASTTGNFWIGTSDGSSQNRVLDGGARNAFFTKRCLTDDECNALFTEEGGLRGYDFFLT